MSEQVLQAATAINEATDGEGFDHAIGEFDRAVKAWRMDMIAAGYKSPPMPAPASVEEPAPAE